VKLTRAQSPEELALEGPIIEVVLYPRPLRSPPIPMHSARLLIDTGAQLSVVEAPVLVALGMPPIDFIDMTGVSGIPQRCPVYRVTIELKVTDGQRPGTVTRPATIVGSTPPGTNRSYVGLLGRDFLQSASLAYDGTRGTFELSFRP
jgi:hypothetical protein